MQLKPTLSNPLSLFSGASSGKTETSPLTQAFEDRFVTDWAIAPPQTPSTEEPADVFVMDGQIPG